MEERSSPRLVTQRQLEVEPPRPAASPTSEVAPSKVPALANATATPPPPAVPAVSAPVGPSNLGLLDRQLRWYRERAKFEASRPAEEASR